MAGKKLASIVAAAALILPLSAETPKDDVQGPLQSEETVGSAYKRSRVEVIKDLFGPDTPTFLVSKRDWDVVEGPLKPKDTAGTIYKNISRAQGIQDLRTFKVEEVFLYFKDSKEWLDIGVHPKKGGRKEFQCTIDHVLMAVAIEKRKAAPDRVDFFHNHTTILEEYTGVEFYYPMVRTKKGVWKLTVILDHDARKIQYFDREDGYNIKLNVNQVNAKLGRPIFHDNYKLWEEFNTISGSVGDFSTTWDHRDQVRNYYAVCDYGMSGSFHTTTKEPTRWDDHRDLGVMRRGAIKYTQKELRNIPVRVETFWFDNRLTTTRHVPVPRRYRNK